MGNCLFFKPNDKNIKTPRPIKNDIENELSQNKMDCSFDVNQPIDLIVEDIIPPNLLENFRKKNSEFSIETPSLNKMPTHVQNNKFFSILIVFV